MYFTISNQQHLKCIWNQLKIKLRYNILITIHSFINTLNSIKLLYSEVCFLDKKKNPVKVYVILIL